MRVKTHSFEMFNSKDETQRLDALLSSFWMWKGLHQALENFEDDSSVISWSGIS